MADNKQNTNPNVPNLRFPEFSEDWVQTTIGEIGNIKNGPFGSILHAEDYVSNGVPIVTTEHFKFGTLPTISEGIPQVSDEDYIRLKGYVLNENDIVFSRVGSVDINALVGKKQSGWLFSGRVLRVRPMVKINPLCLHYVLSTESVKKDIRNRAVGQTMPSINTPILSKTALKIPNNIIEQNKIASLLSLLDNRIATQNKIIQQLQSLIKGIRYIIYTQLDCEWIQLSNLVVKGLITLKRGNVIPKYEYSDEYCYPVYSSSTQNGGLMGYFNTYMFDKSLISWSIDGGGNFFYRDKHKFNVTNVCGYLEADERKFDYRFISELLIYQHSRMVFDYQTKAHPSVIEAMYYLPILDLEKQQCYSKLFEHIYDKLDRETSLLNKYEEQKKFLLSNMFI